MFTGTCTYENAKCSPTAGKATFELVQAETDLGNKDTMEDADAKLKNDIVSDSFVLSVLVATENYFISKCSIGSSSFHCLHYKKF